MRNGVDWWFPRTLTEDTEEQVETHHYFPVHRAMLVQICLDYGALPDPRTLKASEIRFFYEHIRASVKERTKPAKTN